MATKTTYYLRAVLTGPGAPKTMEGDVAHHRRTVPIEPIDPIPSRRRRIGLTYVRTIGLPPLQMAYAYGDCTGRIVNGKVRLLFSGDEAIYHSPIYEVEISDANVATLRPGVERPVPRQARDVGPGRRRSWPRPTRSSGSARAGTCRGCSPRPRWYRQLGEATAATEWVYMDFATAGTAALNGGHYYHPELDLLIVTYADSYNVAGRPDWNCRGAAPGPRWHDRGVGPVAPGRARWRRDAARRPAGRDEPPPASHRRAPILACTGLELGQCRLSVGDEPRRRRALADARHARRPDRARCVPGRLLPLRLLHGPGLSIRSRGTTSEPIRSTRRPLHPYVHEAFPREQPAELCRPRAVRRRRLVDR